MTVVLRAIDANSQVVSLSDEQRRSVRLIDYDSGEPLSGVPASGIVEGGWGATQTRNEYEFFPGNRAASEPRANEPGFEFFTWYVQTVESSPKKIGCQVTRDTDTIFKSNADNFKKSVELLPQRLPSAHETRAVDYPWEVRRVTGGENDWDTTSVDYYYCGLSVDGSRVQFRSFIAVPASMIQWESSNPASELFTFTGYGAPGSTSAVYAMPAIFDSRKHNAITAPRSGEGIIVAIRDVGIRSSNAQNPNRSPCNISAMDEFGTEHLLRVEFKSSSNRNELVISRR
ncbi:hypothetical protein HB780_02570 (plasmid) [Rhizobium lusitanum]|uniref:hypothetical protein n=1 Tax=Rhizobium lusitanum TaxID=293958 RepID=UPI001607C9B7|nr:hypothetical protein [Rhizobium lusitanum]QND44679.1 hypothetical protein HB780_02570 [Rhizobium lusitanum]